MYPKAYTCKVEVSIHSRSRFPIRSVKKGKMEYVILIVWQNEMH